MGKRKRKQESSTSSSLSASSSSDEETKIRRRLRKYKNKYKMAIGRMGPRFHRGKENAQINTAGEAASERYRSRSSASLVPSEGSRAFLPTQDGDLYDDKNILPSEEEVEIETIIIDEPSDLIRREESVDPLSEVPSLSKEVLRALGREVTSSEVGGDIIHNDLAKCWESILKQGLGEGPRQELVNKYPPIKNCPLVAAPKLNFEVRAAVNETTLKRDERLAKIQTQVGASLSGLGKALSVLVGQEGEKDNPNLHLIEAISDAARLLADVHFQDSESRRALVSLNLNKDLACTLSSVAYDGWLFGENLGERVKAAKAIERSGIELKNVTRPKKPPQTRSSLNVRAPSRPLTSQRLGGPPKTYSRGRYRSSSYPHSRDQSIQMKTSRKFRQSK